MAKNGGKVKYFLIAFLLLNLSCAKSPNSSGAPSTAQIGSIAGTWKLLSAACSGQPISVGDMTETFTVTGSTMSIKDSSAGSDCAITSNNITLTSNGQNVFTSGGDGPTCSKVNCTPTALNNFCQVTSCQIPFVVGGISVAYSCPQNFPMFLDGLVSYSLSGNNLVRTVTLPDKVCLYTYSH